MLTRKTLDPQIKFSLHQPSSRVSVSEDGILTASVRFVEYSTLTITVVVTEDNVNCFNRPDGALSPGILLFCCSHVTTGIALPTKCRCQATTTSYVFLPA